jgi:cell division protein FtsA
MFGIGGRSFTRTIANELGVGYEEAEKLKLNLSHEKIKPDVKKVAMKAIDKTLEVWLDGVELALSEFDTVDHLPSKLLLCGGGASLEQLVEALSEQKWYEELPFSHKPKVQLVKPSDIVGIVDQTGKVNDHTFITATGLLRVGCDTIESNDTDSVKDKINKIDIVGFLSKKGNLSKEDIGRVDVKDHYAFAAVSRSKYKQVLKLVQNEKIKGVKALIELAK